MTLLPLPAAHLLDTIGQQDHLHQQMCGVAAVGMGFQHDRAIRHNCRLVESPSKELEAEPAPDLLFPWAVDVPAVGPEVDRRGKSGGLEGEKGATFSD